MIVVVVVVLIGFIAADVAGGWEFDACSLPLACVGRSTC